MPISTRATVALLLVLLAASSRTAGAAPAAEASDGSALERGRYLTHEVAMCVQCHTPRTADGDLEPTRLFQGAAVPLTSPWRGEPWAPYAPAIGGTSGLTDADMLSVLTLGRRTTGQVPRPPMPPFRLTRDDALAVIGYLRSVGTASSHSPQAQPDTGATAALTAAPEGYGRSPDPRSPASIPPPARP